MIAWIRQTMRALTGISIVCASPAAAVAADARSLILEHLSTLEGLPQGTVYATLQDSQGFVWFGTEDGLVRYDGREIHRYAYSPRIKDSLPGNFIFSIVEDKHADLWIAVKGAGVARWNRASDTFTVFKHDKADARSISSDFVRTLLIDSRGLVWLGTLDAGVDVLDPQSGRIDHLRHRDSHEESLINDQVYDLIEDRHGDVWIGTATGIDRWRYDRDHLVHSAYLQGAEPPLAGKQVMDITDGGDDTFWVGTFSSGLFHLTREGQVLANLRHSADDANSISSDEIHAVLDDHAGHLWVGTADGLDYLSRANDRIGRYVHEKGDPGSLSDSFIMSLYEDGAGLLWIGTRAGGVNRWNSHSWELGGTTAAWLDGRMVTAFADGENNHLWVGTLGGGLFDFDIRTGEAQNLDAILGRTDALADRRIMSLHRDRHGDLWIGTWGAGLKKLSRDGQVVSIPVASGDPHGLSAAGIAAIYEAKNGSLWIGTHGGGANILDPSTGVVRQIPFSARARGATTSENVTSFTEDRAGNVWIGTESGGLDIADASGTVFQTFSHDDADPHSLAANIVYSITTDASGNVWIATDGGGLSLAVGSSAEPASIRFATFSLAEGLSSDTIYAVLPDSSGRLWLSGNAGLMRFDPRTRAVKTYHREHGLQGEEFNSGAYLRMSDGRLCFGGPNGFNVFDPSRLSAGSTPPRIALTGLEVLGAPVHETTPYWLLSRVPLDYRASVVSFDFAALDFTSPNRNRLAYRVTGLTDKWIDLNSQRRVTLTNLDAGDHLLEIRAANADSSWSTVPYRLAIHKEAAPWQSAPAYTAYAAVLIGLVLWAQRSQRRKLRSALDAQQQLESEVALRTKELRDTNQQLIVASEAKSSFLSRMGHELRTPMNGVVGMAELIARSPLSATQARQIQTIRSSARTLLQILNDLLDLSKAQAGKIMLESLPLDLNQLIDECVAIFTGAAESKGIDLIICPAPRESVEALGDPLRLRQILMNLIGNAVKFTEKGEVVVRCDIARLAGGRLSVTLAVADTGVGISAMAQGKIFEPFTQADETTTRRFGGTGLGLSICHELVGLMGGTIEVQSHLHVGSTFTVSLALETRARESAIVIDPPSAKGVVILSRRRALNESLRRHVELLGMVSRSGDESSGLEAASHEVILVDAESYGGQLDRFLSEPCRQRTVVIAAAASIETYGLESKVAKNQLLRSPVQRDALLNALSSAGGPDDEVMATDATGAYMFPRIRAHVLIVEDDNVNGTVAEGYLAVLGCTSAWVEDGAAAVARAASEHFDLILMDLNMPGLDGYATTARIRAREPAQRRTPIIALTANNAAAYREACLAAGMDGILSKPYPLAEFAKLLRRWTGKPAAAPEPAVPPTEYQGLSVVDGASVLKMRSIGKGGSLYAKLVAMFEKNCGDGLARVDAALTLRDCDGARAAAHKLKGAAANVGALMFSAQLGELERLCGARDETGARRAYENLMMAHPTLLAELNNVLLRESA